MSEEQSLMLGDRINWPYILGMTILKVDETIVRKEGSQSEQQVRESVLAVYDKIPDAWVKTDKQWKKDIDEAIKEIDVDVRPVWGGIKLSEEYCRNNGIPITEKKEKIDPHKLLHACVNVFQRRSLLSKTIYQEVMIPRPEDFEEKENDDADR